MTPESPAVQQAVKLLTDRHDELGRIITAATAERQSVAAALTNLGVPVTSTDADVPAPTLNTGSAFGAGGAVTAGRRSVRLVTLEAMNSTDRVFSNEDLLAALVSEFPDRDEDQLRANLRSALFQLRKADEVVQVSPGMHIARHWRPQNAESPTVGAVGLSDPVPTTREGGGASGTDAHRVRDDTSSGQAEHLDHDLGAPVMGA